MTRGNSGIKKTRAMKGTSQMKTGASQHWERPVRGYRLNDWTAGRDQDANNGEIKDHERKTFGRPGNKRRAYEP